MSNPRHPRSPHKSNPVALMLLAIKERFQSASKKSEPPVLVKGMTPNIDLVLLLTNPEGPESVVWFGNITSDDSCIPVGSNANREGRSKTARWTDGIILATDRESHLNQVDAVAKRWLSIVETRTLSVNHLRPSLAANPLKE